MPTLVNKTHYFFEGFLTLHPDEPMKLTSNRPKQIYGGARVMAVSIAVPQSLFGIPQLQAKIMVTEEQARTLIVDTKAMASALAPIVGAEISISVIYPEAGDGAEVQ
ncbi:MAG: hypothetical protein ACRCWF_05595 [Beijerinckiaceae bacterium]